MVLDNRSFGTSCSKTAKKLLHLLTRGGITVYFHQKQKIFHVIYTSKPRYNDYRHPKCREELA